MHIREQEDEMVFQIGDRIAHPLHGAGIISDIEITRIDGGDKEFYVLRLPVSDMLIKIPVDTCEKVGVRPIISCEEADRIIAALSEIEINMNQNWNKRYRENMVRIRSGDLLEVAGVIKGLMHRDAERGLSTGERKMLHSAKQILVSEIVLSKGCAYSEIEEHLSAVMV